MPKFEINYGRDMPEEDEEEEEEADEFYSMLEDYYRSIAPEDNGGVVYSIKPNRLKDMTSVYEVLKKTIKGDNIKISPQVSTDQFKKGLYGINIGMEGRNFEITDPKLLGETIKNIDDMVFDIGFLETGGLYMGFTFGHAVDRLGEIDE